GAAYHSSKEAYLNDIYRQKILEGNGFVFHRIWSTNWWRNPQKEARRLINFIEKTSKSKLNGKFVNNDAIKNAFTDTINTKEESHIELKEAYKSEIQGLEAIAEIPIKKAI